MDGFSVPRAGGGTAPVPPDESHLLRQKQKTSLAGVFCYSKEEEVRFEGNVPVRGKRHPVDGFSVPRAGGGTAPVPPDESHLLRQQQKDIYRGAIRKEGVLAAAVTI